MPSPTRLLLPGLGTKSCKAKERCCAAEQGQTHPTAINKAAQQAVTYARDHLFERGAVHARKDILASALDRSMGHANSSQVWKEFERRVQKGEFRLVENVGTGPHYTTAAMLHLEHETIATCSRETVAATVTRCLPGQIFGSPRRTATRS